MGKRETIEELILSMIRQGTLAPGEKLPSIRSIAAQCHVSMTPVTEAYENLVARHWIESRPRSGYYVCASPSENSQFNEAQSLYTLEHYSLMDDFLYGYSQVALNADSNIVFPFGSTATSDLSYPNADFNASLIHTTQSFVHGGNYQVLSHDYLPLKRAIMKWMLPTQCKNSIDDLSLVNSVSEGLMLAIRSCTPPGSTIAIEAPGHVGFYFSAKFLNCSVIPVPSKPSTGLDVAAFESILSEGVRPACLVLTSNFSNPTGALMPDEEKIHLTSLCSYYKIPIIEDDILGDLYFTQSRPRPLKSFDDDNVIYISGFAKCLAPAIRLGYISAGKHAEKVAFQKHITVSYVNPYIQHALADYLEQDRASNYVNFFRKQLQANVEQYRNQILSSFPPGTTAAVPSGGPYLWVTLPDTINADVLSNRARAVGISIAPARLFNTTESMRNSFRINCAAINCDHMSRTAIRTLSVIANELWKKSR